MSHITFVPPCVAPPLAPNHLRASGCAVLRAADVADWIGASLAELHALDADWAALPPDEFLKDGGRYRRRRHGCFIVHAGQVQQAPHRAHWQPVEYNALHGGMERWFAPMQPTSVALPVWNRMLLTLARLCDAVFAPQGVAERWFVEAHQFRIDTEGGIGRPTPEGAHRDGVDLVAVFLVDRRGVKGGETRVFEAHGPAGQRFTLTEPWSVMLLDDARMIHETTPIQPLDDAPGWRDTLVVTCRRGGFQSPSTIFSGQAQT